MSRRGLKAEGSRDSGRRPWGGIADNTLLCSLREAVVRANPAAPPMVRAALATWAGSAG